MKKGHVDPQVVILLIFTPKSSNMDKNNVVAEIFNAGSENSFEVIMTITCAENELSLHLLLKGLKYPGKE